LTIVTMPRAVGEKGVVRVTQLQGKRLASFHRVSPFTSTVTVLCVSPRQNISVPEVWT
jgi:hypothetical protein